MSKTYKDIFTEEEIEEDKADLLKMFQNGIPIREMTSELGRTKQYIEMIKKELIAEGLITEEEIKVARERRKEMFPPAQGGPKLNKVHVPKVYTKQKERKEKTERIKQQIEQAIKEGKPVTDICTELRILDSTMERYITQLIGEKKISADEVKWQKTDEDQIAESRIDRTTEQYIDTKNKVLQMLKKGYKTLTIRKRLNLTSYDYRIYVNDLAKHKKYITYEEIQERRKLKHLQNLQFVAERVKLGDSLTLIREKIDEEVDYNASTRLANELIELGIITKEEISANRISAQKNSYSKGKAMSTEEQIKYIREKVLLGYAPQEIVDSDETGSISIHSALYQKRRMIAEGIISDEEAKRIMEEHQRELLEEQYLADWTIIRAKTKQGLNLDEIAEVLDRSVLYVSTVKNFAEGYNSRISKKQMAKYKKRRKIREEAERKKKEEAQKKELLKRQIAEQEEEKARNKEKERMNNLIDEASKEEEKELDGHKIRFQARKSLIGEIKNASNKDILLDSKVYLLCYNLYLFHPAMIESQVLKLIMNGLKLTQDPVSYDKYRNAIRAVIRSEIDSEFEL